jgi:hypothetical protein
LRGMSLPPEPLVGSPRNRRRRLPCEMSCRELVAAMTTIRGESAARSAGAALASRIAQPG